MLLQVSNSKILKIGKTSIEFVAQVGARVPDLALPPFQQPLTQPA